MTTNIIDENDSLKELVNFLRTNITDSQSRITFVSQYFSGDDSETEFTPTNSSSWKCLDYVKVGGVTQNYGTDYTINWNTGKITFITAPITGSNNIEMRYGYGSSGAMVYADMPRTDVIETSYPRIGVGLTINTEQQAIGGNAFQNTLRFTILIVDENSNNLSNLVKEVRENIMNNSKTFYNFRYIYPANVNNIVISENETGEKLGKTIELIAPLRYEIIN